MSVIILRGDAQHLPLPDASVDLICTSPPYWNQRSYRDNGEHYAGQIGNEATPREYIAALLECTREWTRVLKPSGSIWVVLGDKYSDRADGGPSSARSHREDQAEVLPPGRSSTAFARRKSLLMLPERYRIGCIDELGLIARAKVVWHKPTPMPESAPDRVVTAHEDVIHLVKSERYFSAVNELRRPLAHAGRKAGATAFGSRDTNHARAATGQYDGQNPLGAMPGSVWEIPFQPLTIPPHIGVEHHAAYPAALPRRIIQGWSPSGICAECGEGRRPVATSVVLNLNRPQARRAQQLADRARLTEDHLRALLTVGLGDTGRSAATQSGTGKNTPEIYALAAEARAVLGGYAREYLLRRPAGLSYACACAQPDAPTRRAVVADPFGGTGTTALVADMLGRIGVTVDKSADYCRATQWRTTDPGERARALGVPKPPPVPDGQRSLFDDLEAS